MDTVKDYHEFSLTQSEVEERKNQLLDELDNNDRLQAEFSEISSKHKGLIKSSDGKISKLRNAIKDGKEMIQVEVKMNDPADGKKTLIRLDNGKKAVVDMTEDEIVKYNQEEIFQ